MQFMEYDPGYLNLIQATYICQSLARMGHQLSKLNDTPDVRTQYYIIDFKFNQNMHMGQMSFTLKDEA